MRNFKWSKALAGCLATVMAVSLMPADKILAEGEETQKKNTSSVVDASSLNVNVDFYDYNIREYKGETVDKDNKIALNAYQKELVSGSSITADQLFLFGGDRSKAETGSHNVWTGSGRAQYQGIVKDTLDANGDLLFNKDAGIYSVNIFPQEGDTELEEAGVVETYYNTNFQFLYKDGTYQYDSTEHASYSLTKGHDGNGVLQTDLEKPGPYFKSGTGTYGNHYGFFPLNNAIGEKHQASPDSRHHMFGMKMELAFFMPENGTVEKEPGSDEMSDMIFRFSGDDDVWVFVDGHLALDLGGIHDTVDGEINFATGDIIYEKPATGGLKTNVTNIYDAYNIDQTAFSEHTLTMFYLERGEYDSNCKITFNIPTVVSKDDISITKKVENVPEGNTDTYDFKLLYGSEPNKLNHVYEGNYKVYDSTSAYVEDRETKDGLITLAAGETAVIDRNVVKMNHYYVVQEVSETERYLSSWITTGEISANSNSGDGKQTNALVRNAKNPSGSHIEFTNRYRTLTKLSLKKEVDTNAYSGEAFAFRVTIGDETYNVSLKDGETKVFEGIPEETTYTITEIITKGAIYTTPDASVDNEPKDVKYVDSEYISDISSWYRLEGKIGEDLKEGEVTEVVYINHAPEVTRTPDIPETATPEVTGTPDIPETATPEVTGTPDITETAIPKVTETPKVTKPTRKPSVPEITPKVVETPNSTPVVTEEPQTEIPQTEKPEEEVPATEVPVTKESDIPATKAPTVVETEKPSVDVIETKVPVTEIPQTEKPQDVVVTTPADDSVVIDTPDVPSNPMVTTTNAPVITSKPTSTEAPYQVMDDDMDVPNNPVVESATKATKKPDGTATPKATKKAIKKTDKDGTIVEDEIPGELPQTGGIGTFAKGTVGFGWLIVVPILVAAGEIFLIARKRNKK